MFFESLQRKKIIGRYLKALKTTRPGHHVLSHWINGIWKGAFENDPGIDPKLEAEDAISEVYREVLATWSLSLDITAVVLICDLG